jgi:hypothetical protein
MKRLFSVLPVLLALASCVTLKSESTIPETLSPVGHVVANLPTSGQVSAFLGDFRVTYVPSAAVTLDPLSSPAVRVVTESLTVVYDKRDPSRLNLLGQTDNYLAHWKGTVNGSPVTLDLGFRSSDYSQNVLKKPSSVGRILDVVVTGAGIDGCDFLAAEESVALPAALVTFHPSLDAVTMKEMPGLVTFGPGVRTTTVGALTWSPQTFAFQRTGREFWMKNGLLYSEAPLEPAEQTEAALVMVVQTLLRAITG